MPFEVAFHDLESAPGKSKPLLKQLLAYSGPNGISAVTALPTAKLEALRNLVLLMVRTDSVAQIAAFNDTSYGRTACLQTRSPARAERVSSRRRAGAIHINGAGFNYGSAFGGYKLSGNSCEGGLMGFEDYLEVKTLHGMV